MIFFIDNTRDYDGTEFEISTLTWTVVDGTTRHDQTDVQSILIDENL